MYISKLKYNCTHKYKDKKNYFIYQTCQHLYLYRLTTMIYVLWTFSFQFDLSCEMNSLNCAMYNTALRKNMCLRCANYQDPINCDTAL